MHFDGIPTANDSIVIFIFSQPAPDLPYHRPNGRQLIPELPSLWGSQPYHST
jgi:hypothetical protein